MSQSMRRDHQCRLSDATENRNHLCGYDLNLTYPQDGIFPTLNPWYPNSTSTTLRRQQRQRKDRMFKHALELDVLQRRSGISKRDGVMEQQRSIKREQWKRDLSGRANGRIDPWYGCDLYDEMVDYAVNFSLPWCERHDSLFCFEFTKPFQVGHDSSLGFDFYDIPDALQPEAPMDASVFLNGRRGSSVSCHRY